MCIGGFLRSAGCRSMLAVNAGLIRQDLTLAYVERIKQHSSQAFAKLQQLALFGVCSYFAWTKKSPVDPGWCGVRGLLLGRVHAVAGAVVGALQGGWHVVFAPQEAGLVLHQPAGAGDGDAQYRHIAHGQAVRDGAGRGGNFRGCPRAWWRGWLLTAHKGRQQQGAQPFHAPPPRQMSLPMMWICSASWGLRASSG